MVSDAAKPLKGRVALVTGAGSGIGAAAAELLAERGAKVVLTSHTKDEVDAVAKRITRAGGEALAIHADVRSLEEMEKAVTAGAKAFGGIDIVFANAGINGALGTIDKLTLADFDETVGTNLRGTFITMKAAAPLLKRSGKGVAIITASINGNQTFNDPGSLIYSATKAALVAMTKFLAIELARDKVRVVAICPGSIKTEIDDNTTDRGADKAGFDVRFPKGEMPLTGKREGKPIQVARLVAFLASDEADHITGADFVIDGGQSLVV